MRRTRNGKSRGAAEPQGQQTLPPSAPAGPTMEELAELAVDVWKVSERAKGDGSADRVLVACERAEDRLKRMGFEVDAMVGRPYDTNLRVRVVDHDAADGPTVIGQCISPAVFYRGSLVREAEVVTRGEEGGR